MSYIAHRIGNIKTDVKLQNGGVVEKAATEAGEAGVADAMLKITGTPADSGQVSGAAQPDPGWQHERRCLHFPGSMLQCPLYSNQFSPEVPPYCRCSVVVFGKTGE